MKLDIVGELFEEAADTVTLMLVETEAELLMGSAQLMIDAQGAPTKIPVDNPHRNKYRIISTPHLSDTYYTGASGKAWYLFANPRVLPAFEIVLPRVSKSVSCDVSAT